VVGVPGGGGGYANAVKRQDAADAAMCTDAPGSPVGSVSVAVAVATKPAPAPVEVVLTTAAADGDDNSAEMAVRRHEVLDEATATATAACEFTFGSLGAPSLSDHPDDNVAAGSGGVNDDGGGGGGSGGVAAVEPRVEASAQSSDAVPAVPLMLMFGPNGAATLSLAEGFAPASAPLPRPLSPSASSASSSVVDHAKAANSSSVDFVPLPAGSTTAAAAAAAAAASSPLWGAKKSFVDVSSFSMLHLYIYILY
jgi:hypothetical protein